MPWNPKRNAFWQGLLRAISWVVAVIAANMAWQTRDVVGATLAATLIIHLLTTTKKRRKT